MNYTHYLLSFTEKTNKTTHPYAFFSISEYVNQHAILDPGLFIPGDTSKRSIFTIRNKVFDEGIFKVYRNDALWRIIEAFLKGLSAVCVYPIDTIRIPIDSVKCGQEIFGDFYITKVDNNPHFIYGLNT